MDYLWKLPYISASYIYYQSPQHFCIPYLWDVLVLNSIAVSDNINIWLRIIRYRFLKRCQEYFIMFSVLGKHDCIKKFLLADCSFLNKRKFLVFFCWKISISCFFLSISCFSVLVIYWFPVVCQALQLIVIGVIEYVDIYLGGLISTCLEQWFWMWCNVCRYLCYY